MLNESINKNNFAIIAKEDLVLGFKGLGFKTYFLGNDTSLEDIFSTIIKANTTICLVEENLWDKLCLQMKNYKASFFTVFIPFSNTINGQSKVLDDIIRNIKLKATGKV